MSGLREQNASLKETIRELEEALDRYQNGYQGACYCCEPVGMENVRLKATMQELESEIARLREAIERHRSKFEQVGFLDDEELWAALAKHKEQSDA